MLDFTPMPDKGLRRLRRLVITGWLAIVYWLHRVATRLPFVCVGFDGPCFRLGKRGHVGTAYVDDRLNYKVQCPTCAEAEREAWAEMWHEYYRSVL